MKVLISSEVLQKQGLTLQDFGVMLYYIGRGFGDIHPEITKKLWEKNLLRKEIDGYAFNGSANKMVNEWFVQSESIKEQGAHFAEVADQIRELYPKGYKDGTNYMWRDSTMTIAKKLQSLYNLCVELGIPYPTDKQIVDATKRYVDSFHGRYTYMQLLKYFILKNNNEKSEKASQLLSFVQNDGVVIEPTLNFDVGEVI